METSTTAPTTALDPAPAVAPALHFAGRRGPRKDRATLRLTDEEWSGVQARVRETGRTTGRYLRELVLGSVPKTRPTLANAAAVRELARAGNNLNQLAREAHGDGRFPTEARVEAVLAEVLAAVRRLG